MLSTNLVPFIENCHGEEHDMAIFQQANASAHSSRHTNEWFMDNDIAGLRLACEVEWNQKRALRDVYR